MTSQNFAEFKDRCVEEISSLQQEFIKLYDLNSYESWSFDEDYGVFHFESDSGQVLHFRYSMVGSFSDNTSTWKWSWDNENLKASERRNIDKVKIFGEQNGFTELTTGLIETDENTGWELRAIGAKILNAIGVYKFKQEYLTYFIIFTSELTKEEYDRLKEKSVSCETHGRSRAAFVCRHLTKEACAGFHEAFESNPLIEADDDYQAWCDECEKVMEREGDWNDTAMAFAKIKLVCDQCYFEIKRKNSNPPA